MIKEKDIIEFIKSQSKEVIDIVRIRVHCFIIKNLLGEDRVNQNLKGIGSNSERLGIKGENEILSFKSRHRIYDLSDCLYNLQSIQGFDSVIKSIRNNSLEDHFAELQIGKILKLEGLESFKYMKPINGKSYDLEMSINGITISAEIKCKIDSTEISGSTIRTSLEKAASQIKDSPHQKAIFLKIPEKRYRILKDQSEPRTHKKLESIRAVTSFLERNQFIDRIIFVTEEFNDEGKVNTDRVEYLNPYNESLDYIFTKKTRNRKFLDEIITASYTIET